MDIDLDELPKQITMRAYARINTKHGFALIGNHPNAYYDANEYVALNNDEGIEVTFDVPSKNKMTGILIDGLKEESKAIRAKTEKRCQEIDDRIQSLLALPAADLKAAK